MEASQEREKGCTLGNFYLESLNQGQAKGKRPWRWAWWWRERAELAKKKKKKKAVLGVQTSWSKVTGTGGCRKSEEKRTFRGSADKGGAEKALGSWEVPRSRRRHWGQGREGASPDSGPECPRALVGFRGCPRHRHTARCLQPESPPPRRIQLDYIRVHPPLARTGGWHGVAAASPSPAPPPPPLFLPPPSVTGPGPRLWGARGRAGSSVEVATPPRSCRVQSAAAAPPARGNTGHCPAEWGWGPRGARLGLLLSGCGSAAARPGPAPARRFAARRSLLPALALSPARRSPSRWLPSSLQDQQTTPALSASLPQPRSGRRDVTSVTSSVGAVPRAKGVGRRRNVDFLGGFWEM